MKKLLLKIMYALIITALCCWITVELLTYNTIVLFVLGFIAVCVAVYLIADTLEYVLKFILYCSKCKSKKKMKTNETKIKLQVLYQCKNNPASKYVVDFVSKENLVNCVKDAIAFAKTNPVIICKMWMVTTEE